MQKFWRLHLLCFKNVKIWQLFTLRIGSLREVLNCHFGQSFIPLLHIRVLHYSRSKHTCCVLWSLFSWLKRRHREKPLSQFTQSTWGRFDKIYKSVGRRQSVGRQTIRSTSIFRGLCCEPHRANNHSSGQIIPPGYILGLEIGSSGFPVNNRPQTSHPRQSFTVSFPIPPGGGGGGVTSIGSCITSRNVFIFHTPHTIKY